MQLIFKAGKHLLMSRSSSVSVLFVLDKQAEYKRGKRQNYHFKVLCSLNINNTYYKKI